MPSHLAVFRPGSPYAPVSAPLRSADWVDIGVDTMRTSVSSLAMTDPSLASATDRALDLAMRPGRDDGVDDLRDAMRQVCADARRQGLRPEELIVLFKETWRTRPELRALPREAAGSLLDQVVTMCIQEYYGGG